MRLYLAQLIRQTGISAAGGPTSPAAPTPQGFSPTSSPMPTQTVIGQETETELTTVTPQTTHGSDGYKATTDVPAGAEMIASSPSSGQRPAGGPGPAPAPAQPTSGALAREMHISALTESAAAPTSSQKTDALASSPSAVSPPPQRLADVAVVPHREASELIRKVMNWVAQDNSESDPLTSARPDSPDAALPSAAGPLKVTAVLPSNPAGEVDQTSWPAAIQTPASSRSARTLASPPPAHEPGASPWSVEIGTIHLTIEAPAEKPAPRPIEPRALPTAPTSRPAAASSRLRRHYLRPF